jgi:UDP-N-acetyl-D-mannosaminuronate dehydrogenase
MLGSDLYLVHSPERVFTGRIFADLRRYPKLLGGVDEPSANKDVEFYEAVLDFDPRPDLARPNGVWDLGSAEAAELAKLAETSYRDVNIGLANELDAVIVHTDHAEYADLAAEHFPGIRALLDGRYITRPELWPGVQRAVFGVG